MIRAVLAPLLIAEALLTSVWIARHLPGMTSRAPITIAIITSRALVGTLGLMSGMWLIERRRIGAAVARVTLVASALLTTLELGWRLAPSNLDPAWRWPAVAGAWMYACVWLLALSTAKNIAAAGAETRTSIGGR